MRQQERERFVVMNRTARRPRLPQIARGCKERIDVPAL
jgi:hypothetical protein